MFYNINPVLYDFLAIVNNLDTPLFKITASSIDEAYKLLSRVLIGDDYCLEDFDLKKLNKSDKSMPGITSKF